MVKRFCLEMFSYLILQANGEAEANSSFGSVGRFFQGRVLCKWKQWTDCLNNILYGPQETETRAHEHRFNTTPCQCALTRLRQSEM